MASSDSTEILVKFTTKFEEYRLPPAAISVPASLNQAGLSQVVAHILGKDIAQPFEFYVAGEQARELEQRRRAAGVDDDEAPVARTFVRSTLRKYAKELGLSTEDVLVLEYAPALEPPTPGPSGSAPEWIGALTGCDHMVFAGLYDGSIAAVPSSSLYGSGTTDVTASLGHPVLCHAGQITGLAALDGNRTGPSSTTAADVTTMVSAAADGVVKLWTVSAASAKPAKSKAASGPSFHQVAVLDSSGEACGAVAIDPTGESAAGGDASGAVYVWSLADADGDATEEVGAGASSSTGGKRKRSEDLGSGSRPAPVRAAALTISEAHTAGQQVSSVAWLGSGTLASGSWDHSIVVSDIESEGASVLTFRPGKVVTCLAASTQGGSLASGHPDGIVRVWDPRGRGSSKAGEDSLGGNTSVLGLRGSLTVPSAAAGAATGPGSVGVGGATWISSVAWCPTNAHLLAGTAYTGATMLWDVRSPGAPLHVSSQGHEGKALAVQWLADPSGQLSVLSGGEDKRLRSMRVSVPAPAGGNDKDEA